MRNARFWVWWRGGPVKLTLKPGQRIDLYCAGRHEEGWSSTALGFEYDTDDDVVVERCLDDGTDCDGRLTAGYEAECAVTNMMGGPFMLINEWYDAQGHYHVTHDKSVRFPQWEPRTQWQRDYAAEAMGY